MSGKGNTIQCPKCDLFLLRDLLLDHLEEVHNLDIHAFIESATAICADNMQEIARLHGENLRLQAEVHSLRGENSRAYEALTKMQQASNRELMKRRGLE